MPLLYDNMSHTRTAKIRWAEYRVFALESVIPGFESGRGLAFHFHDLKRSLIEFRLVVKLGGNVRLVCCWFELQELGQWDLP